MELVNEPALARAARKHAQIAGWLANWAQTTRAATWQSIADVRAVFPHADAIPLRQNRTVVTVVTCFNAGGNDFRLLTVINYRAQRVMVLDVLTHAEYDKNRWKKGLS